MRRGLEAVLIGLFGAILAAACARGDVAPGHVAALDAFADPFGTGDFGALFDAWPARSPGANSMAISSSPLLYSANDLAFLPDRSIVIIDRDADPSGLGPDANGDHGPGAVFIAAAAGGAISVLSDGSDYPAGLPPATSSIFVDPRGIAVTASGQILVADADADPSRLGNDSEGFAGHGALFAVSPAGSVSLISDGATSDDGLPPAGSSSWFEDPGAVVVARDGRIHVLDIYGDPRAVGGRGAVYLVDAATGRLHLEAVWPLFAAPTGIAELADGSLVVSDQLTSPRPDGSRGALLRIDLSASDPTTAVTVLSTDSRFRGPGGLGAAPDGSVFVADPFADPLGLGRIGALLRWIPDGSLRVASSTTDYQALASVRVAPPTDPAPTLTSVTPAQDEAGHSPTIVLAGTGFVDPVELRIGSGVTIVATRFVSANEVDADLSIDGTAAPGSRDVTIVNPDFQAATLAGGFIVMARSSPRVDACAPAAVVQGLSATLAITGDRFVPGASLSLGAGVQVDSTNVIDPTRIDAHVTVIVAAIPGLRDVVVTNPDGTTGRLAGGFEVLAPAPPQPTAIVPSVIDPGATAWLDIDGTGFTPGTRFDLGTGVDAGPADVPDPFHARLLAHASALAAPGPRDVTATALDGTSGTLLAGFAVSAHPAIRVTRIAIDDSEGNANSAIDAGETVGLDITLWNAGAQVATGLAVRLVDPSPGLGLTLTRPLVTFPDALPQAIARRAGPPLPEIRVAPDVACGSELPLDIEVLSAGVVVAIRRVELPIGRVTAWARKPDIDGDTPGGDRGGAVALADVDGDGVADLVVGAPREDPGGVFAAGRVTAVSGVTDDVLWTFDGVESNGQLGDAIAAVGDVDGDGREDLLIGAPGEASDAGRVRLVSGADRSLLGQLVGPASGRIGSALALAGDRDLDGRSEALVGASGGAGGDGFALIASLPALVQTERLDGAPGEGLGASLADLGDVDGDGRSDVAVGAPNAGAGRVIRWLANGLTDSLPGRDAGESFGHALASGADANDDGIADLLVGAPAALLSGGGDFGRVDLISGRTWTLLRTWHGDAADDALGSSVAFLQDIDGDGVAEALLGAPGASTSDGLVQVRSTATGLLLDFFLGGAGSAARFGESLAAGRDAGGDAFADVLVGQPRFSLPLVPLAGRAVGVKTQIECAPVFECLPDGFEPNDPGLGPPTPLGYGATGSLSICHDDEDTFLFQPPAGRRMLVDVLFQNALGDLDARLYDGTGTLVDSSLSSDDNEELGPFGPGGTYVVHVYGFAGARNIYTLDVLDPDSCPPLNDIVGLRVRKASATRITLTWQPSTDTCHAQPPATGYRIWAAPTVRPIGPVTFPAGTTFVGATSRDLDLVGSDERFVDEPLGTTYYLVSDIGRAGEDGPVGAY